MHLSPRDLALLVLLPAFLGTVLSKRGTELVTVYIFGNKSVEDQRSQENGLTIACSY